LQRRERTGDFIENLLALELDRAALRADDRGLALELAYGAVRWQATLDFLIARKTPGRAQQPALQILLRLGLYQIFWLDRIPDHAAVNETVELARQAGFGPQSGFVNALLRGYLRERAATAQLLHDLKSTQPALGGSHPAWLVERWTQQAGAAATAQLLEWNNTPPRTYARVNTLKTDAASLLRRWREDEVVEYDFFLRDWTGESAVFLLKAHPALESLRSFQDGWFYVQDPSTLLAVQELNPQPGETVLDLCAAPGGKTTFIAQRLENRGAIHSQDASAERLKLVAENCARLGVTCAQIELAAPTSSGVRRKFFDRVLLDAPPRRSPLADSTG